MKIIKDHQLSIERFANVIDDLYRGSAPSKSDLNKLKSIYKIERIVSLDEEVAYNIHEHCINLGLEHIILPINHDYNTLLNVFYYNLDDLLLDKPTFVHCLHGKDRTGLIIALLQCKYLGMSKKDALKQALSLDFCSGLPEKISRLYVNLIKNCKPIKNKSDSIVDKSKDNNFQTSEIINMYGESGGTSIAPYSPRTYSEYTYKYDQPNVLSNNNLESNKSSKIPLVGLSDNPEGMKGFSGVTAVFNQSMP